MTLDGWMPGDGERGNAGTIAKLMAKMDKQTDATMAKAMRAALRREARLPWGSKKTCRSLMRANLRNRGQPRVVPRLSIAETPAWKRSPSRPVQGHG